MCLKDARPIIKKAHDMLQECKNVNFDTTKFSEEMYDHLCKAGSATCDGFLQAI